MRNITVCVFVCVYVCVEKKIVAKEIFQVTWRQVEETAAAAVKEVKEDSASYR
jgi:hypothetical protein